MKNKKYYLHICGPDDKHAGSKAVDDCQKIFEINGYKPIVIYKARNINDFLRRLERYYRYVKLLFIKHNSTLVVQHPLPMPSYYLKVLSYIKEKHNVRLVYLIHDLDSLRRIRNDDIELVEKRDNLMYKNADVIIAHNNKMKQYLIEKCGIAADKVIILGIFDYLPGDASQLQSVERDIHNDKKHQVIIAGNLSKEKSGYIYKLVNQKSDNMVFNLYGVNYNEQSENSCGLYKGAFSPEELLNKLEGEYGLVWDGTQLDSCSGTVGEYLKYNNPHKISLYIAAEIPVIIWEKAALADFVKSNNIGLTIDSLNNLNNVLNNVTAEEYHTFKENLKTLSKAVRRGQYLTEALGKLN